MIQKCPHCQTDVIFSRDICPACGHPSRDGERGEATYLGEARSDGRPVYNHGIETLMTARQRNGRVLTGLICGAIPAPLAAYSVVRLLWLSPDWLVLLAALVSCWVVYHLWCGSGWARWVAASGTLFAGLVGLFQAQAVLRGEVAMNAVQIMAYVVFALVYLWCAWQLARSPEVKEFLVYQHKHAPEF